jgi:hypothetical protein
MADGTPVKRLVGDRVSVGADLFKPVMTRLAAA